MFVNQPDDAQLVALWHDPGTCPAIASRLGVSQTSLTLQWRRLRQQDRLPTDRRRNGSERTRGRVHRRRRRPADHQDARPPVEATDRRPRRAAVRLVQLEESDVFVSQPMDGVIYVARKSLKGRAASPSEKTARVNIRSELK